MNLPHYAVTLSTGFKSDLNRTLILNQMNPLFYAVFYSLFLDPVSKVHVFYSAPCSHTHSMCSSLNMTDMLHTLIPYLTTGVHYDRSFVRWSSQDGSSTSIGTAVLSPDCIWCSTDGAADRKTSGTTQGWGLLSRWHHHHWCPCNGMWRCEVSYTDYVGGSYQNFKRVYQTIYLDRLGAKFSNMLIIFYM